MREAHKPIEADVVVGYNDTVFFFFYNRDTNSILFTWQFNVVNWQTGVAAWEWKDYDQKKFGEKRVNLIYGGN